MNKRLLFVIMFNFIFRIACAQSFDFSGIVLDSLSKEGIYNAQVTSISSGIRILTNRDGNFNYKSKLSVDSIQIVKEPYLSKIVIIISGSINFILMGDRQLKEILISGKEILPANLYNHSVNITAESLEKQPMIMGEKDITRVIENLPGVQISGGSSSGYSVRGGGADQNQILFDQIPIYGVNHFFGFLSSINSDILSESSFYKGFVPVQFGGKLSSVLDIKGREGNMTQTKGGLTFNPIVSRIWFETPIIKNKVSVIAAARRSYMDFFYNAVFNSIADYYSYRFFDANIRVKYKLNQTDNLVMSFFNTNDKFKDADDNGILYWKNSGLSLKYTKLIRKNLYLFSTIVKSDYVFNSQFAVSNDSSKKYESKLESVFFKVYLEHFISNSIRLNYGIDVNKYNIQPEGVSRVDNSIYYSFNYKPENYGLYADFLYNISKKINITFGIRYDLFNSDRHYNDIQPRSCLNLDLNVGSQVFISYCSTSQAVHQLTSTGIGLPTETYVPSITSFDTEEANIYNIGFNKRMKHLFPFINVELFYRTMKNIIEYKPGATFLILSTDEIKTVIPHWQDNITQGKGHSYGFESTINIALPNTEISLAYTLSYSLRKFDDINFGEQFYSKDDHRHKITANILYKLNHSKSPKNHRVVYLNILWNYASANPVNLPLGYTGTIENNPNTQIVSQHTLTGYEPYNSLRIQTYHRLDISIKISSQKKHDRSFECGIINVYNRNNPIYYYLSNEETVHLKQKSFYPILPYVSYTIKF